jgi:hypothetical protein
LPAAAFSVEGVEPSARSHLYSSYTARLAPIRLGRPQAQPRQQRSLSADQRREQHAWQQRQLTLVLQQLATPAAAPRPEDATAAQLQQLQRQRVVTSDAFLRRRPQQPSSPLAATAAIALVGSSDSGITRRCSRRHSDRARANAMARKVAASTTAALPTPPGTRCTPMVSALNSSSAASIQHARPLH